MTKSTPPSETETATANAMAWYENLCTEVEEVIAATIATLPLTVTDPEDPFRTITSGGPLNRRLAFELAEMMTEGEVTDLYRFAKLVSELKGARG